MLLAFGAQEAVEIHTFHGLQIPPFVNLLWYFSSLLIKVITLIYLIKTLTQFSHCK